MAKVLFCTECKALLNARAKGDLCRSCRYRLQYLPKLSPVNTLRDFARVNKARAERKKAKEMEKLEKPE